MDPVDQILFLAIYSFLWLTSRAETVKCAKCKPKYAGGPCYPMICEVDPTEGFCHAQYVFKESKFQGVILGCMTFERLKTCVGTTYTSEDRSSYYTHKCCTDVDFCNFKYLKVD